jgi:hypothetical protein
VRAAKTDHAHRSRCQGEGEAESLPSDPAESAVSHLAVVPPIIDNDGRTGQVELRCISEAKPMLRQVRHVLGRIELNLHDLSVALVVSVGKN